MTAPAVRSERAGCFLLDHNGRRDGQSECTGFTPIFPIAENALATLASVLVERGCAGVTPETLERTLVVAHARRDRDKAVVSLAGRLKPSGDAAGPYASLN